MQVVLAVRRAEPRDYEIVYALAAELGIDDQQPPRDRWLAEAMPRTLVADRGGAVIGYVLTWRLAAVGHVQNLVVAPAARGAGVGEELMRAAAVRDLAGLPAWQLNVKVGNAPAIALYERLGMTAQYRSAVLDVAPAHAAALVGAVSASVEVAPIEAADDVDVERSFDWPEGRIARARGRGNVLVGVRAAGTWVGATIYDSSVPLAAPFAGSPLGVARTLFEALSVTRTIQAVIERDDELIDALLAAGARLKFRLLKYRGALP